MNLLKNTYSIALKLPQQFNGLYFHDLKARTEALAEDAKKFVPQLKKWLEAQGLWREAASVEHVYGQYLLVECDQALCDFIYGSFIKRVDMISPMDDQQLVAGFNHM